MPILAKILRGTKRISGIVVQRRMLHSPVIERYVLVQCGEIKRDRVTRLFPIWRISKEPTKYLRGLWDLRGEP